jgi:hypothetical protein
MARGKSSNNGTGSDVFVTSYRHHKTGKIMKAKDYGLKAFHFLSRKRKKDPIPKDDPIIVPKKEESKSGS